MKTAFISNHFINNYFKKTNSKSNDDVDDDDGDDKDDKDGNNLLRANENCLTDQDCENDKSKEDLNQMEHQLPLPSTEYVILLDSKSDYHIYQPNNERSANLKYIFTLGDIKKFLAKKLTFGLLGIIVNNLLKLIEFLSMIVIVGMITFYLLLQSSLEYYDFEVVAIILTFVWYISLICYFLPLKIFVSSNTQLTTTTDANISGISPMNVSQSSQVDNNCKGMNSETALEAPHDSTKPSYTEQNEQSEKLEEEDAELETSILTSSLPQSNSFKSLQVIMQNLRYKLKNNQLQFRDLISSKRFWISQIILVCGLAVMALFLSFSVSSICLSTHPNEISTRLTRLFNKEGDYCSEETGLCHVYLVAPEDPMHSMNIIFHSNRNPINARLMIGTSPLNLQLTKFGTTKKMHNIKERDRYVTQIYVDHLEASTLYYFQIMYAADDDNNDNNNEGDFQSQLMKFQTFSSSSDSPVTFIASGDLGLTDSTYSMAEYAKSLNPQFITLGGDIAYENGYPACYHRYDQLLSLLQNTLISSLDQTIIPIIATIGNHEVDGKFKASSVSPVEKVPFFLDYFPHYSPEVADRFPSKSQVAYHYHVIGEKMLLINLDSNHINKVKDQVAWLIETLEKFKGYEVYVQYHAPAYPIHGKFSNSRGTLIRDVWTPIFDKYNVTIALENHGHCYKRTHLIHGNKKVETDGTLYLGDGSWGAEPQPMKNHNKWYINTSNSINNILHITVNKMNRKTHFASHTVDGTIIDSGYLPFRSAGN